MLIAVMMAAPMDGGADCNYDFSANGMAALIAIIIAALIVDWRRGCDAAPIAIMMATPVDGGANCSYDGSTNGWRR